MPRTSRRGDDGPIGRPPRSSTRAGHGSSGPRAVRRARLEQGARTSTIHGAATWEGADFIRLDLQPLGRGDARINTWCQSAAGDLVFRNLVQVHAAGMGLSDAAASRLLGLLGDMEVRLQSLHMFGNRLRLPGAQAVAGYVSLSCARSLVEVHLSRNAIPFDGAAAILLAAARAGSRGVPRYPLLRGRRCMVPLWLRLDRNCIQASGAGVPPVQVQLQDLLLEARRVAGYLPADLAGRQARMLCIEGPESGVCNSRACVHGQWCGQLPIGPVVHLKHVGSQSGRAGASAGDLRGPLRPSASGSGCRSRSRQALRGSRLPPSTRPPRVLPPAPGTYVAELASAASRPSSASGPAAWREAGAPAEDDACSATPSASGHVVSGPVGASYICEPADVTAAEAGSDSDDVIPGPPSDGGVEAGSGDAAGSDDGGRSPAGASGDADVAEFSDAGDAEADFDAAICAEAVALECGAGDAVVVDAPGGGPGAIATDDEASPDDEHVAAVLRGALLVASNP